MFGFISAEKMPVRTILIGAASALAVTLLLMCAICGVMLFVSSVPYDLMPYIMLIADAGGVFFGGYLAASMNKSKGLIMGLMIGLIQFVILFVAGLSTGDTIGLITFIKLAVLLIFGMLGGIKGVNRKEKIRIK